MMKEPTSPSRQRKAGTLLSYFFLLASSAGSLLLTPLMIAHLGKAEFGLYQLVGSVAGYLLAFDFGTGVAAIRFVAKYREQGDERGLRRYLNTALIITLSLSVTLLALGLMILPNVGWVFRLSLSGSELGQVRSLFFLFLLNAIFTLTDRYFDGLVMAYERFVFSNGIKLGKALLRTLLLIFVLINTGNSLLLTAVDAAVTLLFLTLDILFCLLRLHIPFLGGKPEKALLVQSLSFSFYIFLQALVNQVNDNTDKFLLGLLTDTRTVAVYAVAVQCVMMYKGISSSVTGMFLPRITQLTVKNDKSAIDSVIISTSRCQLILLGGVVCGFALFGRQFVTLWAGRDFAGAWAVAMIIMAANLPCLMMCVANHVLSAQNKLRFPAIVQLVAAAGNVLLSIVLIRRIGYIGAAVATAVAMTIANTLILNVYFHRAVGLNMPLIYRECLRGILPCLAISSAACAPLLLAGLGSWRFFALECLCFTVLFGGLLWLFGLNEFEKKAVKLALGAALSGMRASGPGQTPAGEPSHRHESGNVMLPQAEKPEPHGHACGFVTGRAILLPGGGHYHLIFAQTQPACGHCHTIAAKTGPAVKTGSGHIHTVSGMTTTVGGHCHTFSLNTTEAIDGRESPITAPAPPSAARHGHRCFR